MNMELKDLLKLTNEARREDILCIIGYGVNFITKFWVRTGEGNKHEGEQPSYLKENPCIRWEQNARTDET